MISRRDFLAATFGSLSLVSAMAAAARAPSYRRFLLLIELMGGNDGLNTIVPYGDPQYAKVRGDLAIKDSDVIKLEGGVLGLHPSLEPLHPLYLNSRMAVLQGVGLPWMTSGISKSHLEAHRASSLIADASLGGGGWVARAGSIAGPKFEWTMLVPGVSFNCIDDGPLSGFGGMVTRHAPMRAEHELRKSSILNEDAAKNVLDSISKVSLSGFEFPDSDFGRSMAMAARLVLQMHRGQVGYIPVIRVGLGSFDTHEDQLRTHANLLSDLALGVRAFYDVMSKNAMVKRVLSMTYSEFGRSVKPNDRGGTEHGFASDQLLFGDGIYDGYHGRRVSLADASLGNDYSLDYRSICSGILAEHLMVDAAPILGDVKRHGIYRFGDRVPNNFA